MSTQTPPVTYLALQFIAEIHPGDNEALIETIENILCPLGHSVEPGDHFDTDHDCRIRLEATTGHPDLDKVMAWMLNETPEDASNLETT